VPLPPPAGAVPVTASTDVAGIQLKLIVAERQRNVLLQQHCSELEAQNEDAETQIAELHALLAERDGAVEALHAVIRENCMSWEVGKWAPTDKQ